MKAHPVRRIRREGKCILRYVQVQISSSTTVTNEWKLKSADCISRERRHRAKTKVRSGPRNPSTSMAQIEPWWCYHEARGGGRRPRREAGKRAATERGDGRRGCGGSAEARKPSADLRIVFSSCVRFFPPVGDLVLDRRSDGLNVSNPASSASTTVLNW